MTQKTDARKNEKIIYCPVGKEYFGDLSYAYLLTYGTWDEPNFCIFNGAKQGSVSRILFFQLASSLQVTTSPKILNLASN